MLKITTALFLLSLQVSAGIVWEVKPYRFGYGASALGSFLGTVGSTESGKNQFHLWDLKTGKLLRTKNIFTGQGLDFSQDGKWIVIPGESSKPTATVLSLSDFKEVKTLPIKGTGAQELMGAKFSPDGKRLVLGGHFDSVIQVWNTTGWSLESEIFDKHFSGPFSRMQFSTNSEWLAINAEGQSVFWNLNTKKSMFFNTGDQAFGDLLFSQDGKFVTTSGYQPLPTQVWSFADLKLVKNFGVMERSAAGSIATFLTPSIFYVADGIKLRRWETSTWNEIESISIPTLQPRETIEFIFVQEDRVVVLLLSGRIIVLSI